MMKTLRSSLALLLCSPALSAAAEVDFYRDVYPFLKANCISCHNKTTTKADLNMETPALMIKGGESGPSIIPGKSAESLIVAASKHTQDMEMPPANNKSGAVNLTAAEIALLAQWIDQGAKDSVQQERAVAWQPLTASVDPIYSVAMTQDGRYAACGRSNHIDVYDLATRQLAVRIQDPAEKNGAAHRALVQSLAFSPDGKRLASGSFREVKIWQLESTKTQAQPLAAQAADATLVKKLADTAKVTVTAAAASGDGKHIAACCADGSVRVWDAATAKQMLDLRGTLEAQRKTTSLEWAVAAQSLEQTFQKGEITRIEAQDKALDILLGKAKEAIVAMNKVLPEKQRALKPAEEARAAAQKAVDEVAAQIAKLPGGKPDAAHEKTLKAAQEKLITAKMSEVSAQAAVAAAQSNVKDAEDDVKRITESKAANAKAVAAANAAITTAKAAHDKAAAELVALRKAVASAKARPTAVAFSSDAQRVAALFDDGTLRVWAAATGTVIEEGGMSAATQSTTLSALPDGSFTATKTVSLNVGGSSPRWVLERTLNAKGLFADRVNALRFSPDGKTLATGGGELSRSGDIHFFNAADGKLIRAWKEKHADTVLCLDFSPDGSRLASGAADKIARVTDIVSGKQVNLLEGHTHHVMGVAFRADGRVLATAGADGVVLAWDMILGERKKKIEGWTKEVTSVQFIGATNQIVTSAGDNRVRVVTDEGGEVRSITNLPDYMQASVSTPNGSTLIAGGEDSVLRVWDGTTGKELAVFGNK